MVKLIMLVLLPVVAVKQARESTADCTPPSKRVVLLVKVIHMVPLAKQVMLLVMDDHMVLLDRLVVM